MFKITEELLLKAWLEIYRSKPKAKRKYSRGIDEVSIEDFKKHDRENLGEIYRQLEGGFFEFRQLKEYKIPRPGKSPRLIQAPTVTDRIVQKVISNHLMDVFQKIFTTAGIVGSVRGTTVEGVLRGAVGYYDQGYHYVLKTDIENYFPSINKKRLKKIFYREIHDEKLRTYFDQFLKQSKQPGIPQGTPLSPFFANLFLLNFDKALKKEKNIKHFRYIDDLVVFCDNRDRAEAIFNKVEPMFRDLGLTIHPLSTPGKTFIDLFDTGRVDVLGVIYKNKKLLIKQKKYREFIAETITPIQFKSCLNSRLSTEQGLNDLLKDLRYRVYGWAGAYSFCDVKETFEDLDAKLYEQFNKLLNRLALTPTEKSYYLSHLPKFTRALKKRSLKKSQLLS
ncbi:MAG: reverse transcriptase domain-containing protein [Patescibacteria group bacterium]